MRLYTVHVWTREDGEERYWYHDGPVLVRDALERNYLYVNEPRWGITKILITTEQV